MNKLSPAQLAQFAATQVKDVVNQKKPVDGEGFLASAAKVAGAYIKTVGYGHDSHASNASANKAQLIFTQALMKTTATQATTAQAFGPNSFAANQADQAAQQTATASV